jgi:hypothetical protein
MLIDAPGKMTAFPEVKQSELFLTFLDAKTRVVGMKIKTATGYDAVLHLHEGSPKLVADTLFVNRDLFLLSNVEFRFPNIGQAMGGHPETHAYGAAILSAEGAFVRASHSDGPFDVDVTLGIAKLMKNHPGSIWFDSWEIVRTRGPLAENLFSFSRQ